MKGTARRVPALIVAFAVASVAYAAPAQARPDGGGRVSGPALPALWPVEVGPKTLRQFTGKRLAAIRAGGINTVLASNGALSRRQLRRLRSRARRAGLRVLLPVRVAGGRRAVATRAARVACRETRRRGRTCAVLVRGPARALAVAGAGAADVVAFHGVAPAAAARLKPGGRGRLLPLVRLGDRPFDAAAWRGAIAAARGGAGMDLGVTPRGKRSRRDLDAYLGLLAEAPRSAPAFPAPPPLLAPAPSSGTGGTGGTGGQPDTTAPAAPSGLSTSAITASAITLSWTASTDNVGVTGYRVFLDGDLVETVTGTSYRFEGLNCWTVPGHGVYTLGVAAVDAAGNVSQMVTIDQQAAECGSSGDGQAPSTPTGLGTSAISETSITLSWSASTDNVGVTGYQLTRNGTQVATTTATSHAFGGLACGTSYTLGVRATDAAGNTSGLATTSASTSACPAAGTGNLWIDKNGGSCTRHATAGTYVDAEACASFDAAFGVSQAGDRVLVRCNTGTTCTFGAEELSGSRGTSGRVTFAAAPGYTVSFEEGAGSGDYVFLNELRRVTFENIGFGRNNSGDSTPNLRMDCARDVTLINASGRRFYMFEGNANVTFQGGDWGNYKEAGEEDSTMGTTGASGPANTCSGDSGPRPSSNILFDDVSFHDVHYNATCGGGPGGCSQWGSAHPDCFEINGYVDGVTVRNSEFFHCGNTMFSLYSDQGDIKNVVVQNTTFRDMAPWSYYGIQWVRGGATPANTFFCENVKFLDNIYRPNAPGGWLENTPPRFECDSRNAATAIEVAGNTFQQGPPPTACSASRAAPFRTNWHDNTFEEGDACP